MCDTLCVLGDDVTLFAKNSDRAVGETQLIEAFPARPPGGTLRTQYVTLPDQGATRVLGARPTWLWGLEHGVNEHRVAIGNERVWTVADGAATEPALIGMDLVRLALERATDAELAVDLITTFIEEHGQGGIAEEKSGEAYYSSFLVADPADAWIIETCGRTWVAKPVDRRDRGASISNRLSIATDWTRASRDVPPGADFQRWRDPDFPTGHADRRLAATGSLARRDPPPTPRDLVAVLRHHGDHAWGRPSSQQQPAPDVPIDPIPDPRIELDGTGVSVCMHLRDWEATAGSLIAELPADPARPLRAWAALASPCVSLYVPIFPADLVPRELADPALWATIDRWRVAAEQHPGQLGLIRGIVGPVEAALWDEADDLVAAGADRDRLARFVGRAGSQVRTVVAAVDEALRD